MLDNRGKKSEQEIEQKSAKVPQPGDASQAKFPQEVIGDRTLWTIAQHYHISLKALYQANKDQFQTIVEDPKGTVFPPQYYKDQVIRIPDTASVPGLEAQFNLEHEHKGRGAYSRKGEKPAASKEKKPASKAQDGKIVQDLALAERQKRQAADKAAAEQRRHAAELLAAEHKAAQHQAAMLMKDLKFREIESGFFEGGIDNQSSHKDIGRAKEAKSGLEPKQEKKETDVQLIHNDQGWDAAMNSLQKVTGLDNEHSKEATVAEYKMEEKELQVLAKAAGNENLTQFKNLYRAYTHSEFKSGYEKPAGLAFLDPGKAYTESQDNLRSNVALGAAGVAGAALMFVPGGQGAGVAIESRVGTALATRAALMALRTGIAAELGAATNTALRYNHVGDAREINQKNLVKGGVAAGTAQLAGELAMVKGAALFAQGTHIGTRLIGSSAIGAAAGSFSGGITNPVNKYYEAKEKHLPYGTKEALAASRDGAIAGGEAGAVMGPVARLGGEGTVNVISRLRAQGRIIAGGAPTENNLTVTTGADSGTTPEPIPQPVLDKTPPPASDRLRPVAGSVNMTAKELPSPHNKSFTVADKATAPASDTATNINSVRADKAGGFSNDFSPIDRQSEAMLGKTAAADKGTAKSGADTVASGSTDKVTAPGSVDKAPVTVPIDNAAETNPLREFDLSQASNEQRARYAQFQAAADKNGIKAYPSMRYNGDIEVKYGTAGKIHTMLLKKQGGVEVEQFGVGKGSPSVGYRKIDADGKQIIGKATLDASGKRVAGNTKIPPPAEKPPETK